MLSLLDHIRKYDWFLLGAVLTLMVLGLATLFSLSGIRPFPFFERQILWAGIGLGMALASARIDFRIFKAQSGFVLIFYLITVILLGLALIAGFTARGTEAWIRVGNFFIQPVEPAKLALIVLLAKFLSKRHVEIYRVGHLALSLLYFGIPAVLVMLQPDFGSVMVLAAIWIAMILFSGIKFRHLAVLAAVAAILAVVSWNFALAPYQKARITAFLNPYNDPQGAGYQMIQSMIAVGSGGLLGKGFGYGSQTHLHFLPEAETDFIFAAFAEEWGFVGMVVVFSLIFIVLWRTILIGMRSSDNFSRLYTLGFAALIFVQSSVHIGMNIGLMPVTGLPLPFVSYGGSSLTMLLVGVGILQNIKINSRREIDEG